jgi:putative SOS response-associated peptidase YedK
LSELRGASDSVSGDWRRHRARHLADALGFPAPPFYKIKANVTNVRNTASGYWKPYLKAGQRCLVSATAFSEPDRNTSKPVVFRWFARPGGELFYFAGIWREWEGNRGTKKMPNVGKHLLFSFLTTEPNGVVEPIHEKAC